MRLAATQHFHVEKCGGTTLQHFFLQAFPREASLWMDRIRDAPVGLAKCFLEAAKGDEEEADRKLSVSMRFSGTFVHSGIRSSMFLQELRRRERVGRIVYIHNPYHHKCVLRSGSARPLLVVRHPLDRYVSHLKHVERYSAADLERGRPLDRAIHRQVIEWDFDELAFGKRSLITLSKYSNAYVPIIATLAHRIGAVASVASISKAIARICLPMHSLGEFMEAICQQEGISRELAKMRSNAAQSASRFNGVDEGMLSPKRRASLRASNDYKVYEVAEKSSRVICDWFGS